MIRSRHILTGAAAAIQAGAAMAQLHEGDIAVRVDAGAIQTGNIDPDTGETNWGVRVFLGTFGEFANFTNDPGLDSPNGAFPPGTGIGFDILTALRVWNGETFEDIPVERIEIRKGELVAGTPVADEVVPGFVIGEANAGGKFHHHHGYTLLDPAGDAIYLLELLLWSDDQNIGPSLPIFIVFNQNRPQDEHDDAAEWVNDHLPGECPADIDGNGVLDLFDFLGFQNLFAAQDPKADLTGDGVFDLFDFLAYQNLFVAGCP
jgi:hypothetical protein